MNEEVRIETIHRYLPVNPEVRHVAVQLYEGVAGLPLVCPHGHVDPRLFADPDYRFASPVDLLIIPDNYLLRMLYSQGVSLESLGIPRRDGVEAEKIPHRQIWQTFAENFYLFRGTPSGIWLRESLTAVFNIHQKLTANNAQTIYDQIATKLQEPDFTPRRLYEKFNIEVLCTTDAATDTLAYHQVIRDSDWNGRILPTFRPDTIISIDTPNWLENIQKLEAIVDYSISNLQSLISALEERRAFFKQMGAKATDHAALTAHTAELSSYEADTIFQRALSGTASADDARRFTGHMLMEMARMSVEDGLVMQLHIGAYRNHNQPLFNRFGGDVGADIPVRSAFTREIRPLLNKYGNHFNLILFNLDETNYARELAPLAGHYPAVKLGPPWWFHDSLNGMRRYFDQVMETAGLYNTVGFNDDTRAFSSIPARHAMWRRASVNWLAGLVTQGIVDMEDATQMACELSYGLAKRAYKLE